MKKLVAGLALSAAVSGFPTGVGGASSSQGQGRSLCYPKANGATPADFKATQEKYTYDRKMVYQHNKDLILSHWIANMQSAPKATAFDRIMLAQAMIACAAVINKNNPTDSLDQIAYPEQIKNVLSEAHFNAVKNFLLTSSAYKNVEDYLRDIVSASHQDSRRLPEDEILYPQTLLVRPSGAFTNCHGLAFHGLDSKQPADIGCNDQILKNPLNSPCDLATPEFPYLQHVIYDSGHDVHSALVIPPQTIPQATQQGFILNGGGVGGIISIARCDFQPYGPAYNPDGARAPNEAERKLFTDFNNLLAVMAKTKKGRKQKPQPQIPQHDEL